MGGTANLAAHPAISAWEVTVCRRIGGPPLRFTGRRIAAHRLRDAAGGEIAIALWQRRKGGFAVALSRPANGAWQDDVLLADTIPDAVLGVESLFETLRRTTGTEDGARTAQEPCGRLIARARQASLVHRFGRLAGLALDRWMEIEEARNPASALRTTLGSDR